MFEIINKKFVKRSVAIFIAFVLAAIGIVSTKVWAANVVYSIWVPSQGVEQISGVPYGYRPTDIFTVADGDTRMLITLRVEPKSGNPSYSNVIVQEKGLFGWKNVQSANVSADNITHQPFGIMSVKAGKKYRVVCNCVGDNSSNISSVNVIAVFASYTS